MIWKLFQRRNLQQRVGKGSFWAALSGKAVGGALLLRRPCHVHWLEDALSSDHNSATKALIRWIKAKAFRKLMEECSHESSRKGVRAVLSYNMSENPSPFSIILSCQARSIHEGADQMIFRETFQRVWRVTSNRSFKVSGLAVLSVEGSKRIVPEHTKLIHEGTLPHRVLIRKPQEDLMRHQL